MLFTSHTRKGILVTLMLISGIILIPQHFLPQEHSLFLLPAHNLPVHDTVKTAKDSSTTIKPKPFYRKKQPLQAVELNSADSTTLVAIKGIGPYYATKIIHYRQRLGGYHSVQQLKELNMTYFQVDSSAHFFKVDPTLITPRNMDSMTFKAILSHPYLEYEDVQMIFDAKRKYGQLSYHILETNGILAKHKLKKIKPYFK